MLPCKWQCLRSGRKASRKDAKKDKPKKGHAAMILPVEVIRIPVPAQCWARF